MATARGGNVAFTLGLLHSRQTEAAAAARAEFRRVWAEAVAAAKYRRWLPGELMAARQVIEAAGGVLWRAAAGGSGIEVALVHRPKYDDWSIPKGKLNFGEHPCSARSARSGRRPAYTGVPGGRSARSITSRTARPSGSATGRCRRSAASSSPNDEVDQMMWLPPREAQTSSGPDRDQGVWRGVDHGLGDDLAVPHGASRQRRRASDLAGRRPRAPTRRLGDDQAEALVPLLAAYGIRRVMSADVLRCMETIGPYASVARLPVESEPLLSEAGYAEQPDLAGAAARDHQQRRAVGGVQPGQDAARVVDGRLHRAARPATGRTLGAQGRDDGAAPAVRLVTRAGGDRALRSPDLSAQDSSEAMQSRQRPDSAT